MAIVHKIIRQIYNEKMIHGELGTLFAKLTTCLNCIGFKPMFPFSPWTQWHMLWQAWIQLKCCLHDTICIYLLTKISTGYSIS